MLGMGWGSDGQIFYFGNGAITYKAFQSANCLRELKKQQLSQTWNFLL